MYKQTTLDSINHNLRSRVIHNIIVAKNNNKGFGSFVLRFYLDLVSDQEVEEAKNVVAEVMNQEMAWGELRPSNG